MATNDKENDILKVLEGLSDGRPNCISDILFGFQKYPEVGSEDDQKIKLLEQELINQKLVKVTEQGGTNETSNGYYYFIISPFGAERLRLFKQGKHSQPERIFNALSTNEGDPILIREGLSNHGLLGFLDVDKSQTTFPLEQFLITFPRGQSYFYTLDTSNERFENRKPIRQGVIGYARKTPNPKYHQLFRFFNDKQQHHLFVVNPNFDAIMQEYSRDESKDNPIYIKRDGIEGDLPLYLYSNSNFILDYFTPLAETDDSDSYNSSDYDFELGEFPNQYLKELEDLIKNSNIDYSRVKILHETKSSTTVQIIESMLNFYVNLQRNGEYFTVRRNPEPDDEAYIIHDLKSWPDVIERFKKWLQDVENKLPDLRVTTTTELNDKITIDESINVNITRRLYSNTNISIGDSQETEPALGVESLANEIVKIIKNLKSEPGNMTGIFAQWGRGKTRLMNEIWKRLSSNEALVDLSKWNRIINYFRRFIKKQPAEKKEIEYIRINYQAWRYQDTPASWAYLYEQFSLAFLGNKKGIKNFLKYHIHLLDLNVEREGVWGLICAIGLSIMAVFGVWLAIPLKEGYNWIISWIGVPFLGFLIGIGIKNFRLSYFSKAMNLIKKYSVKTSFNETLGIQAEIQKELIHLVSAWVTNKKKKKLVLFVDDLDRCNEEKTIEIIDALRIMLDDEKLKDKLLVITAIDERILQLAVGKKYEHAVSKYDECELIREYIDKLFIFSIKLGVLNESESIEFFEKFTKNEVEPSVQEQVGKSAQSSKEISSNKAGEETKTKEPEKLSIQNPSEKEDLKIQFEKIEKLSHNEIEMFKKKLGHIKNSTPRKIRILYYRYLFVRNLLILKHPRQNENSYWLIDPFHGILIHLLIDFSQRSASYIDEQRVKALEVPGDLIDLDIEPKTEVSKYEYLELLKIFELTIAY